MSTPVGDTFPMTNLSILHALGQVRARVAEAAGRAGRDPSQVELVAVTKGVTPDRIREAYAAGIRRIGENRVQEAVAKMASLGDLGLEWRLIGHLQGNKVNQVVGRFAVIESVDSEALLNRIAERARIQGLRQRVLLQVNIGQDPAKYGFAADEVPGVLERARGLENVAIEGFMTIAPLSEDPRAARLSFQALRTLRDTVAPELETLSMGMTNDFECAVEEGATHVRIGSGLFGPRIQA